MKKKDKKNLLPSKIIRETFSGSKKHPGFQARMIAALIDLTVISIMFIPLFILLNNLIYGDTSPSDLINQAMVELISYNDTNNTQVDLMSFIHNTPEYNDYFFKEHGFIKVAINQVIQFICLAAVILAFWIKKQATPGKMLLYIKIVDATTLGKPTNRQLIIRLFSYIISVVPLFLGMIWLIFDDRKQAWHDKIANTLVVRVEKKYK